MKDFMDLLTFLAVLGSGLMAGVFFAFSTFVMKALGQLPSPQGIAAMKAINVTVLNPWFFLVFFGTVPVSLLVAGLALRYGSGPSQWLLFAGSALYVIGCFAVTVAFNVPLNDQLAAAVPDAPASQSLWGHYLTHWTFWNHVRTVAPILAVACFVIALRTGGKSPPTARTIDTTTHRAVTTVLE